MDLQIRSAKEFLSSTLLTASLVQCPRQGSFFSNGSSQLLDLFQQCQSLERLIMVAERGANMPPFGAGMRSGTQILADVLEKVMGRRHLVGSVVITLPHQPTFVLFIRCAPFNSNTVDSF